MGQQSVLKYLEKCKEPKRTKEIAKALKVSNVGASMKRLRKQKAVNFKKIKGGHGGLAYVYWSKK